MYTVLSVLITCFKSNVHVCKWCVFVGDGYLIRSLNIFCSVLLIEYCLYAYTFQRIIQTTIHVHEELMYAMFSSIYTTNGFVQ